MEATSVKSAVNIGCHTLVLGRIVTASAQGNPPFLLKRLRERPLTSALLKELKTVATEVKEGHIEDEVGAS